MRLTVRASTVTTAQRCANVAVFITQVVGRLTVSTGALKQTTKSSCEGANASDEARPSAHVQRKKHRVIGALKRRVERTRTVRDVIDIDDTPDGAVDDCYSICGDLGDGVICGPHACTTEAAGSCCPTNEDGQRTRTAEDNDTIEQDDDDTEASEAVYRTPAAAR